ncbi:hypothetical protein NLJ89_g10536 [Agrocybe chaxingu]|uniref:Uncharacterized protein n=1 Tax=Agrocybe chaxingu TaxID=84603 RepID=A0A9W8JYH5_9AGAR|nr:hypothetical protein NLJ89_g10536 [Agrocybe chaxingu]
MTPVLGSNDGNSMGNSSSYNKANLAEGSAGTDCYCNQPGGLEEVLWKSYFRTFHPFLTTNYGDVDQLGPLIGDGGSRKESSPKLHCEVGVPLGRSGGGILNDQKDEDEISESVPLPSPWTDWEADDSAESRDCDGTRQNCDALLSSGRPCAINLTIFLLLTLTTMPRKKAKSTRQADATTAEQAMVFFMSSIRDPHKVTHCGQCLCGALLTAVAAEPDRQMDTSEKLPATIRKNLEFWNLLLSFFVTPRTDEEIDRLLTAFSECRCQLTESGMHQYHGDGHKSGEGLMNRTWMEHYAPPEEKAKYSAVRCAFVVQGFAVLYAGLHDGGIKSVAKGVTHTWPSTPLDLVPFGADELVQTMLQWYRLVPDPIVM